MPAPLRRRLRRPLPLLLLLASQPFILPLLPSQWEKYERKVAERSAEQQSALSKSAGLLDSMRKRFGTPTATPAADPMATPRAGLIATVAGGLPPTQLSTSSAVGATPRPTSGTALKENLAAELNRSLGATPAPHTGASSFAAAAAAAAAVGNGGGGDSALQQASNLFLQQVEGMRRKYTAEVDRLKVRVGAAGGWNGWAAHGASLPVDEPTCLFCAVSWRLFPPIPLRLLFPLLPCRRRWRGWPASVTAWLPK